MSARDEILGAVGAAVRGATAPPVERRYRRSLGAAPAALLDLFEERIRDYGVVVTRTDEVGLPGAVAEALARNGATVVVAPSDLPQELLPDTVERVAAEHVALADLARADGVVTGCAVAIAESGTIVLDGEEQQGPRAATLVPDLHVCIVREEQVAGLLPEALERLEPGRPLTFVSGPSATSDIELRRVQGVHGPRRLEVVLVASVS